MNVRLTITVSLFCFIVAQSFITHTTDFVNAESILLPKLSEYNIFIGEISELVPGKDFVKYELSSTLFTDYAEKVRLIKIPTANKLTITNDGLPQFPTGTILAKTFFYWKDKRDTARGKRVIETRVLVKTESGWQAGTYLWNAEQNEAVLTNSGSAVNISWLDEGGEEKNIKYQVPSIKQCNTCHNSNNELIPIGFKVRNLNVNVSRENGTVNQLKYFNSIGITNNVDPSSFSTLPAWNNSSYSIEQRTRAYLEVNCAHCHSQNGFCSISDFRPAYENSLDATKILEKKNTILKYLRTGRMPLIGTTVVHKEGVQLIEDYLNSLK